MTILKETVWIEDCTLANLIWRKFRRQPDGFIEKVLDLNPGLSSSMLIPVGTEISFPVDQIAETKTNTNIVRLWD